MLISYVKNFDYTGGEQTWTAPYAGYYKLEVWGAQGGVITGKYVARGGYGGYSVGIYSSQTNGKLFVYVGGQGQAQHNGTISTGSNGYNGGGVATYEGTTPDYIASGGGGASHISTVSGLLKNLSNYKGGMINSSYYNSPQIIIVAGGGGGGNNNATASNTANHFANGGNGGGIVGNNGEPSPTYPTGGGYGGSQTTAYGTHTTCAADTPNIGYGDETAVAARAVAVAAGFGQGAIPRVPTQGCMKVAGGGGLFGGSAGAHAGGGGGSGYIGSSNLISGGGITKHMTCYSCTTSSVAATRTYSNTTTPTSAPTADVARIGNGYAKITWLGNTL